MFSVIRRLLFFVVFLAACVVSSVPQHRYGNNQQQQNIDAGGTPTVTPDLIRVQIDTRFTESEHRIFREAMIALRALAKVMVEVEQGKEHDLEVKYWDNPSTTNNYIGLYTCGTNFIQIASSRIPSDEQIRTVFLHEVGHWMGMGHICSFSDDPNKVVGGCSEANYGRAIMNPSIGRTSAQEFTMLDVSEYHRPTMCGGLVRRGLVEND